MLPILLACLIFFGGWGFIFLVAYLVVKDK